MIRMTTPRRFLSPQNPTQWMTQSTQWMTQPTRWNLFFGLSPNVLPIHMWLTTKVTFAIPSSLTNCSNNTSEHIHCNIVNKCIRFTQRDLHEEISPFIQFISKQIFHVLLHTFMWFSYVYTFTHAVECTF